jgi:hypothetical protein
MSHTDRTVLNWVQSFGPLLATEVRRRRRPVGKWWIVGDVLLLVLFRKGEKRYVYRANDEDSVVVDVLHSPAPSRWRARPSACLLASQKGSERADDQTLARGIDHVGCDGGKAIDGEDAIDLGK